MASDTPEEPANLPAPVPETRDPERQARQSVLAAIPDEAVWLANFVSPRTRKTYQAAVQSFVEFHGFQSPEELRGIGQSHLIVWHEHLVRTGASNRTIQNRLSAVSWKACKTGGGNLSEPVI